MNTLEELKRLLQLYAQDWNEQDRQLAYDIAKDLTQLMARDLQGEDVSNEVAAAKAAARNIASAAQHSATSVLTRWLSQVTSLLLSRFL